MDSVLSAVVEFVRRLVLQ